MAHSWKTTCGIAVLGLGCLSAQFVKANDLTWPGPWQVQVDCKLRIKFYNQSELSLRNLAPWYLYFPADPMSTGAPAGSMYPTWPSYPSAAQAMPTPPSMTMPSGHMPPFQPTGMPSTNVPSYWFAR